LNGDKVLVTGGAGFIGSHLVRRLVDSGCRVVVLVKPSSDLQRISDLLPLVELVPSDLDGIDAETAKAILTDVRIIYHLAAAGVNPVDQDVVAITRTNILSTMQLLTIGHAVGIERFVYCGSCYEYGSGDRLFEGAELLPTAEYGASKAAAWTMISAFARRHDLSVVALRPFTVYGPFEAEYRLIPHTIIRALSGADIELTGGKQTRDFIYVEDAVEAFVAAGAKPEADGKVINVCSGVATSVRDIVAMIFAMTGSRARPIFGAVPYRDTEMWNLSGDPSLAIETLGWRTTVSIEEGVARTIEWFRQSNNRRENAKR
jgi:UDP-glucose 4-epimerase